MSVIGKIKLKVMRMCTDCTSLLGLAWILLILVIESSSDEVPKESEFVKLYGNNEDSGIWNLARDIRDDKEKLKKISQQVHFKMYEHKANIVSTDFATKELLFRDEKYKPIKIDVIMYTIETAPQFLGRYGIPWPYHFTKGPKQDCVYYLVPRDPAESKTLSIMEDVCGIDFHSSTNTTILNLTECSQNSTGT